MVVRSPRSLALVSAALALVPRLSAGVIDVPAQQPSIQAGIDAAAVGDTVLVAPGHYVEHVDFHGKAITVKSSSGAEVTTIDGGGVGSVVTFASGEGPGSVLQGFTITGGAGIELLGVMLETPVGGGIRVTSSAPLLRSLVVTGNAAASGAGVFTSGSGPGPSLLLCEIRGNQGGGFGASLGKAQLVSCALEENAGAGLDAIGGAISLTDCTVRANTSTGVRFSADAPSTYGTLELEGCEVSDNTGFVGGLVASLQSDTPFVTPAVRVSGTRFSGNQGSFAAAAWASAPQGQGKASFEHCVFTDNGVPGLSVTRSSGNTSFLNCTFADNPGPVALAAEGVAKLTSCIVRNNPGTLAGALNASWSDVQGGAPGVGNIDADPLFKDEGAGDFRIAGGSPCIDSGDPAAPADADGTRTDMGAIAFAPFTDVGLGLAGAAGTPVLSGTGTLVAGQLAVFTLAGAKPNAPFALIAGASALFQPFKGGTLVPAPDVLLTGLTDAGGNVVLAGAWPAGIPHGFITWVQFWITDAGGPKGYAASNGLAAEAR